MFRNHAWAVVAVAGLISSADFASAVPIDTFSGTTDNFILASQSGTGLGFGSVMASANAIGGDRQGAFRNYASGTSTAILQPGGTEGLIVDFNPFVSSTFYMIYGANPGNTSLTGLNGLGNGSTGVALDADGATGILLKNLATNAAATIGITLFNGDGSASRIIEYFAAPNAAGADYFFSFANWSGGGVSVSNVGGIIVSITTAAVLNNDAYFLDSGPDYINISSVSGPSSGAIVITPEPAALVLWGGLLLLGGAFSCLRKRPATMYAHA